VGSHIDALKHAHVHARTHARYMFTDARDCVCTHISKPVHGRRPLHLHVSLEHVRANIHTTHTLFMHPPMFDAGGAVPAPEDAVPLTAEEEESERKLLLGMQV